MEVINFIKNNSLLSFKFKNYLQESFQTSKSLILFVFSLLSFLPPISAPLFTYLYSRFDNFVCLIEFNVSKYTKLCPVIKLFIKINNRYIVLSQKLLCLRN